MVFGNLKQKLLFTIADKGMIAFAFIVVSMSVIDVNAGWFQLGYNLLLILIIVFTTYAAVWLAVGLLTFWSSGMAQSSWMRYGLAALTAVFILWSYPIVLSVAFWIFGFQLTLDVETVLTWTFAIRFAVKSYLRRRYHME